ncbi:hemagglutinin domain protein [Burkholderia pseudomallei 406e]|nr:hemagglutinin domain protein [Burkholderia pseudomallei 406e]
MHAAAGRDAERGHEAGAAPLRDAAADDVRGVGPRRDVQQKDRRHEQAKMGDAEHAAPSMLVSENSTRAPGAPRLGRSADCAARVIPMN